MFDVVKPIDDTAKPSRIVEPSQLMAGKTGSNQFFCISTAERAAGVWSKTQRSWNRQDHALFTAFAPYDAPQIAVSILVEHGGGGSTAAASIAHDLVSFYLNQGLPPLSAYPTSQRSRLSNDLAIIQNHILPPNDQVEQSPT